MNLPAPPRHILILTGEPSGDMHGGRLIHQIKKMNPGVYISGIGGPCLKKEGVDLFYDIDKLSVMGFTEVLMQLGQIKKAFSCFKDKLKQHKPDLIILVDYPGFNLKAARYAKENYPLKILYYITPKVWAWKKNRLKKIKKYVDFCALILPFEKPIFNRAKIPNMYVGNPLMDEYPEACSKPFIRLNALRKASDALTIGLLPGSRKTEIENLGPVMAQTARLIHHQYPNVVFQISKAVSISMKLLNNTFKLDENTSLPFRIIQGPVKDILIQSDMVIAASGTVTLEAALCCVPTIIIYKTSYISYKIARLLVKIKYAGLANLIVNREVMPELLQDDATPDKISLKALSMIDHLTEYEKQLTNVRKRLGRPGASFRTAQIAHHMIRTFNG